MTVKKFTSCVVFELAAIIGLQGENREIEVGGDERMEASDGGEGI